MANAQVHRIRQAHALQPYHRERSRSNRLYAIVATTVRFPQYKFGYNRLAKTPKGYTNTAIRERIFWATTPKAIARLASIASRIADGSGTAAVPAGRFAAEPISRLSSELSSDASSSPKSNVCSRLANDYAAVGDSDMIRSLV